MPFPSVPRSGRSSDVRPWNVRSSRTTLTQSDDADDADDEPDASDERDEVRDEAPSAEGLSEPERTDRWGWAFVAALVLVGAGFATSAPALVAAAVVPLATVAYGGLATLPEVELSVSRDVEIDPTAPGEPVDVELTVVNESDGRLADVRLVDLVPEATPVRSGSPRATASLAPGESATVSYTLGARRGVHEFGGVEVRVRNAAGSVRTRGTLAAEGDRELTCELPVDELPLADVTTGLAGAVAADEHGEGLEFHGVREYRRGDDPSDVDWRRYARTGELTTVRYREERAATVVLVVDARDAAYVAADPELPSAADLSAFAAERAFDALARSYHEVGLAALLPGSVSYVEPARSPESLAEVRDVLEGVRERNPLGTVASPDRASSAAASAIEDLERRLPGRAQVVYFTPATDAFVERFASGLLAHGYPVTVVAPEVTTEDEPGQHVVGVERERRLVGLRGAGARVVEWPRELPLPLVLQRAVGWGDRP